MSGVATGQEAVDKAAEAARKLASSTNSSNQQGASANPWSYPYPFAPS